MLLVEFGVVSVDEVVRGRLSGASRPELSYPLHDFLTSLEPIDAFAVLLIDEAQHLGLPLLEEIRILSDLEARGRKLLQVVLVGQPELSDDLKSPRMRQVEQRVSMHCELEPLTRDGVGGYVDHRLQAVGASRDRVAFATPALDVVFEASGGVPRVVNLICDRALHLGALARAAVVDATLVVQAVRDLKLRTSVAVSAAMPAAALQPVPAEAPPVPVDAAPAPASASHVAASLASASLVSNGASPAPVDAAASADPDLAALLAMPARPSTPRPDAPGTPATTRRAAHERRPAAMLTARPEAARSAPAVVVLALTTLGVLGGIGLAVYMVMLKPLVGQRAVAPSAPAVAAPATPGPPEPTPGSGTVPATTPPPPADTRPADPLPPLAPAANRGRAVSAPSPANAGWIVQVGAFGSPERAAALVERLLAGRLTAFVRQTPNRRLGTLSIVFVGPFDTRDAAEAARTRMREDHDLPDAQVQPLQRDQP